MILLPILPSVFARWMNLRFDKLTDQSFPDTPYSIAHSPWKSKIQRILQAALTAADPYEAVRKSLKVDGNNLRIDQRVYSLANYERIRLIGMGKACLPMAACIRDLLGDRISDGFLVIKERKKGVNPIQPGAWLTASGFSVLILATPFQMRKANTLD